MLRYINSRLVRDREAASAGDFKCFILLLFGALLQCALSPMVQCTKKALTALLPLPKMELLRRTIQAPRTRK
jgi:hypothetical protein